MIEMIDKSLENFLLDDDIQSKEFTTSINGNVRVIKEIYDDRFNIIYIKHLNNINSLKQNDYSVGGYYDKKDKCIYDCDFWIENILSKDGSVKVNTLYNLKNKIIDEIIDLVKKYSFDNEKKLSKIGLEQFNKEENWRIENLKKDVQRDFVNTKDYDVELYTSYIRYCFDDIMHKYNGDFYIDYLNNPTEFVNMCSEKVINTNKERMAYELVVYNFKKEYLNKILNNNQEFNDIYISKKILNAIEKENFHPQKVRITINYNNKDFTFLYNYIRLVSDIRGGATTSYDYKKNYNDVSEFLKQNKKCIENRYMEEFELSHVKSIYYGRKELYRNDNVAKCENKRKERER